MSKSLKQSKLNIWLINLERFQKVILLINKLCIEQKTLVFDLDETLIRSEFRIKDGYDVKFYLNYEKRLKCQIERKLTDLFEALFADRPFAAAFPAGFFPDNETDDELGSSSSVGADPFPRSSFGVFSCNFFRRLTKKQGFKNNFNIKVTL